MEHHMQPARIKPHAHRSTQTTPSRDLTLGVMQLVTLRLPETLRDRVKEVLRRFPTKGPSRNDTTLKSVSC